MTNNVVMNRMKNRLNSDRADSNSVSMILWIVFTVVLVIAAGAIIYNAVWKKAQNVGECINKSGTIFNSTSGNADPSAGGKCSDTGQ